jgi:hypothetical protein
VIRGHVTQIGTEKAQALDWNEVPKIRSSVVMSMPFHVLKRW